ncbi:HAD-IIIA family hydrolase [Fulvivirga maritima]|uniref:KdsC family phosphatase n=1 Tax=Fulvivirga maritima TaxID=2904247 RepID=UPI001F2396C7|nr:HAD-IIIA family hydrolase [Fulvivirga maritima]UII24828.1 HAD-IIIA family hydrolase [Fulvivirga maritima]
MEIILKKYTQSQIEKAKNIKAFIFDVDGVLTDGGIVYSNSGDETKVFNVKDGAIIKHLRNSGLIVGAITGRESALVERRCKELKLDFFYQGIKDKFEVYKNILSEYNLSDEQVAYIGDDIIDLKVIINAGLGIAPADGVEYIKAQADLITEKGGGSGVVREAADFILSAQGFLENIINQYKA